jgi:endonuclease-3
MFPREKAIKQLEKIKLMGRKMRLAAEGWENPFQTLIAIVLSARTRDETTIEVCKKLFERFPTAERLSKANPAEVEKIIMPVNFFQNKSKNIVNCARDIVKKFGSKIPESIEKMTELPGVGRKTANVFLSEFSHDALGVDTHVTYISNYLGWVSSDKQEIIERTLKELFPKNLWSSVNPALVRFGKTYTSSYEKNRLLDEIKKIE